MNAPPFDPVGTLWPMLAFYPASSFLVCAAAARVGIGVAAWPWRGVEDGFWVDRARRAHPVRYAMGIASLLPFVNAALVFAYAPSGAGARPALRLVAAVVWLFGYIAIIGPVARAERRILGLKAPLPGRWQRMGAQLLLRPYWLIVALALVAMPARLDAFAGALLAVTAVLLHRVTKGDGVRVARRLGLMADASPRLAAISRRAACRMGRPPAAAFEMPSLHAAAFALPGLSGLIVTSRALEVLADDDLEAVCAHELGHLAESPRVLAARSAAVVWLLPLAAAPALIGSLGWGPFVAFVLLLLLFTRFQLGWARKLEQRADGIARAHEPAEGAYARALARIYEANLLPVSVSGPGRTHPHLYDRLVAAGAPPDYPRPQPPSRTRSFVVMLASVLLAVSGWTALMVLLLLLRSFSRGSGLSS